jgi:hypothetical protein
VEVVGQETSELLLVAEVAELVELLAVPVHSILAELVGV